MFSVGGPTERWKGIVKVTIAFQNFGTQIKMFSTSTEYLQYSDNLAVTAAETLYCLSAISSYTRGPLADTNTLRSKRPKFIYQAEGKSSQITLRYCVVTFLLLYYHFLHDTINSFFPNQNNYFFCVLYSVCITN